jgi:hypothetical protein
MKLPKDVVADPRHDAVMKLLTEDTRVLWENGVTEVPSFALNPRLTEAIQRAFALKQAFQGLEQISKELAFEQKGLDALLAKTPGKPQNPRISRLLLIANDGSERFYRECDSLLNRYGQRLLGCRIDVTGEELGEAAFGSPKLVRAALIVDKKATAQILLSLLP